MTVIEDFKSASVWGKLAFILLAVASGFASIAFTTTGWGSGTTVGTSNAVFLGLWRECGNADIIGGCTQVDGWANGNINFTSSCKTHCTYKCIL